MNNKKTKAINTELRSPKENVTFKWGLEVDIKDDVIQNNVT